MPDELPIKGTLTYDQTVFDAIVSLQHEAVGDGLVEYYEDGLDNAWFAIPTEFKFLYNDPLSLQKDHEKVTFWKAWEEVEKLRGESVKEDKERGKGRKRVMEKRRLISDLHHKLGLYFGKPNVNAKRWKDIGEEHDRNTD